jgi:hypothetical protein
MRRKSIAVDSIPDALNAAVFDEAAYRESQPHGGHVDHETRDGLEDRASMPYYSHRQDPAFSTNRTLTSGADRRVGECSVEDGVTFREPLRTDLDSTFGNGH